jgi:hypothetical protein
LIKPRTTCWNVQRLKLENRRCAIASNAGANTAALPGYPTKMVLAPRLAEPINGEQYERTTKPCHRPAHAADTTAKTYCGFPA